MVANHCYNSLASDDQEKCTKHVLEDDHMSPVMESTTQYKHFINHLQTIKIVPLRSNYIRPKQQYRTLLK
jgi:hypothetical protein